MCETWKEITLGDQTRLTKGVTYASSDYCSREDGYVFLTIKCVEKGGGFSTDGLKYYRGPYIAEQVLRPGDLIIALTDLTRAGDIVGGPVLVPDLGAGATVLPSMDLAILRPLSAESNLPFLFYRLMLQDARRYMLAHAGGTTVLHLETKAVPKFKYLAPSSTDQARIAKILSTVDEAIEQTEALIAKTQQIKAGLMHDLFTRGVTADGQLRPPREEAPQLYKESPLGWIPKEWVLSPLGMMSEIVSGVTLNGDSSAGGIEVPYLRVANVQDGYLDLGEVKTMRVGAAQLLKLALRHGDVLMNEGGDFDKLGRGTVWNEEIVPCIHQNHVFRVRPYTERLRSRFLAYWSQSEFGKKYFVLSSKQSTNLASINSTQLHRFPIAKPSYSEQEAIETQLIVIDSQIDALQDELGKLRLLRAGLMHDLLTGRARVAAEVSAEPTEVAASV